MAPLEPIPVPAHLRWREFKIRILPVLVFTVVAAAAVMLWKNQLGPRGIIGQVEVIETRVGSPASVVVSAILVGPNQAVHAGDALVRVLPANAGRLAAELDVIRAEAAALKSDFATIRPQNQIVVDYERLRLDSLEFKAQLAVAKVQAELAESEVRRGRSLAQVKIMSDEELDRLESIAKARHVQVDELTTIAAAGEQAVANAQAVRGALAAGSPEQAISAAVDVQEKKLRLAQAEFGELLLTAPVDGEIGSVLHRVGDVVPAGEPIVTVAGTKPGEIVAFVRQPILNAPKPGDRVQVRVRSQGRPSAEAAVASVSSRLEPLNPALYPGAEISTRAPELALPVRIPVPAGLEVRPGETVDVIFGDAD